MTTLNPQNLLGMFIAAMRDCGHKPEDIKTALQSWASMVIARPPESAWDASQIKQPGWQHVAAAFIDGAREARENPEASDGDFKRAADGYSKRVFEEVDPESERRLRTGDFSLPPPGRGMVPMTEPEEWDFWDVAGLRCAGYNSSIDADLIGVFIESATEGRWYADIAKRLGLQEFYVELLKEILCSVDFCEYGTSPRGAWAIEATFAENLDKLKTWYLGKWDQEFTHHGIKEGSTTPLGDGGSGT